MATATGLQGQKSSPEQMRVRLRPDLVVNRQYYEGQTHYVIKDPVALRYFRFREEEYYLLRLLDGHRTLAEIKDDFERRFQPQTVTIEDLQHFVSQLHQSAIAT